LWYIESTKGKDVDAGEGHDDDRAGPSTPRKRSRAQTKNVVAGPSKRKKGKGKDKEVAEEDEILVWLKELMSSVSGSPLGADILIGRLSEAIEIVQARKRASDFSGFREVVELDDDDD
jgi:hypothetical protein